MSAKVDASIALPDAPAELRTKLDAGNAIAWSQPLSIPTYAPEPASEYPMFLDHRVYQGSSGKVYPLPFTERIASEAEPTEWQAIHLENRYVRLVVLPQLGGRIHIGYDKINDYDFFYRNNVIKPALVGLAGPWISGGVEFNWPQHHRPATYLPVETTIEEGADGSVTVWCSDHDPFARMKGMHGVRLHPDRSVVEVVVRLSNRTSERQTFLWWANVAARVGDDYQSFFPEDVRYVADHARRAVTAFPAADRPYYGVDYPARAALQPGTDRIDFYRNIPVPTSYMIVDSEQAFFGGYDHGKKGGFVHWADRRVSPGKKQWTWGNAPFGHAWDRLLTDDDGPYVELMAGVFTDNQPDFSWLLPGETKSFSQFWYPIPAIGPAHQATVDAAINVSVTDGEAVVSAATTRFVPGALLVVYTRDGRELVEQEIDFEPSTAHTVRVPLPAGVTRADLKAALLDLDRQPLLEWEQPEVGEGEPSVATEPALPANIDSVDELYLTGVHLAQYRHPTRSPLPYWHEALRRDPYDSRVNLALADHAYRAGDYELALKHERTALARITRRNSNPQDAEVFYLLGLTLSRLGDSTAAARAFAKAAWDYTWAGPAGLEMARMAAVAGLDEAALADLDALDGVLGEDARRRSLRIVLLKRLGRLDEARTAIADALAIDPLDTVVRYLADSTVPADGGMVVDLAMDLKAMGEIDSALELLAAAATTSSNGGAAVGPVALYLRAAVFDQLGRPDDAAGARAAAREADRRWVFPAGLDAHDALAAALKAEPSDAVASALLGTLLYSAGRRREAVQRWDAAITLGLEDHIVFRNAGLGAFNVLGDSSRAWDLYMRAQKLAPADPRLLFEIDQLAQKVGESRLVRLHRLDAHLNVVLQRDDLTVEYALLLVNAGRAAEALELLESRSFQPWEGGEGLVLKAWDQARIALGLSIDDIPLSLGEGRPVAVPPVAVHEDGTTDYFATSLPELLLFSREDPE